MSDTASETPAEAVAEAPPEADASPEAPSKAPSEESSGAPEAAESVAETPVAEPSVAVSPVVEAPRVVGGSAARPPRLVRVVRWMWRTLLWLTLLALTVWLAVRWSGHDKRTPVAQLISYTPYVAVFALIVLIAALLTRQFRPAIVALLIVAVFGVFVLPRAVPEDLFGRDRTVPNGRMLRVMSQNLLYGDASAPAVITEIRRERPDVVTMQELTAEFVTEFTAAGGDKLLPYHALRTWPGAAGTGIYSRYPLTGNRGLDTRSTFDQTVADLRMPGRPVVEIVSAHPAPPTPDGLGPPPRNWVRDYGLMPAAPKSGPVRIMAGDFNASLDHSLFRKLVDTGYIDAAAATGHVWQTTWPEVGHPYLPAVTIDHVLVDRRGQARSFKTHVIPRSDHKAVIADLMLPGAS
jgi:endonuclease/exonuclease/phosphatase (EEP) superfamily protein YafD